MKAREIPRRISPVGRCNIDLHQDWEIYYWTLRWGITKSQLSEAIKNSGSNCANEVEKFLVEKDWIT